MKRVASLGAIIIAVVMATASWGPSWAEAKETAMVPMRDNVKLATEIYLAGGRRPLAHHPHDDALRPQVRGGHCGRGGQTRLCLRRTGLPRPGRLRGHGLSRLLLLRLGRAPGRVRHGRVDRQAEMVQRQGRRMGHQRPGHRPEHDGPQPAAAPGLLLRRRGLLQHVRRSPPTRAGPSARACSKTGSRRTSSVPRTSN